MEVLGEPLAQGVRALEVMAATLQRLERLAQQIVAVVEGAVENRLLLVLAATAALA